MILTSLCALAQDPGPMVAIHAGAAIPVAGFDVSYWPRLEVGGVAPGGRVMPFATGAFTMLRAEGAADDPRIGTGSYAWELTLRELYVGAGVNIRLLDPEAKVNPEVTLAATAVWLHTETDGDAGGEAFGLTKEDYWGPGGLGAVGVGILAGPGALTVHVEGSGAPLKGRVTGPSHSFTVNPTVGYRFLF